MREFEVMRLPDGTPSRWGFPKAPNDAKDYPLTKRDDLGNSVIDHAQYRARNRRCQRFLLAVDKAIAGREPKVSKPKKLVVKSRRKARR